MKTLNPAAAQQAANAARDQRLMSRYRDDRIEDLKLAVKTEHERRFVKDQAVIAAAQAAAVAKWTPFLIENPATTKQQFRDVYNAPALPPAGPQLEAHNTRVIELSTVPVYRTKADVMSLGAVIDAEVQSKPATNAAFKAGAGSSGPVFRAQIEALESQPLAGNPKAPR